MQPNVVICQPEVNHPKNGKFPESQIGKDIEINFSQQEEIIKQEYNRPPYKHQRDNPELRRQINTNKVVHTFLAGQTDLNQNNKTYRKENIKRYPFAYDN